MWCAALLLRSAVPTDLPSVRIDSATVFGKALVRRAEHVERFFLVVWVLSQITLFATLWIYARRGPRFARESAAGPIGTGMLLGMLGLGIVWLVQLPFGLLNVWWARRYDLSEIGYLEWAFGGWFELAAAFTSICVTLLIVMFLARKLGEAWWIPGAAVFVVIAAGFAFAQPYMLPETTSLDDPALQRSADEFEKRQGVSGIPISVEDVSGTTSQANAYAVGFGPSRKIVLWSTMVDGTFSNEEVRAVLAHEIGHQLASAPAQSWISRRMESEADWKALQTTRNPAAVRGLFAGFAQTSLGDPDPPAWAHVLLDSHPTLAQRVEMAEAWAERHRPG